MASHKDKIKVLIKHNLRLTSLARQLRRDLYDFHNSAAAVVGNAWPRASIDERQVSEYLVSASSIENMKKILEKFKQGIIENESD